MHTIHHLTSAPWAGIGLAEPLTILALVGLSLVIMANRGRIAAEAGAILAETLIGRAVRFAYARGRDQRGGPFGIPDQLIGMLIGATLLGSGFAAATIPTAWAQTTRCSNNLEGIDLGIRSYVLTNNAVPGAGGSINETDASLSAYLPDLYTDPTAPTGVYVITDTSDATNGTQSWTITCPGTHMGLTTLRFPQGSLTHHTLLWDSNTKIYSS